jgi:hypothetical protein
MRTIMDIRDLIHEGNYAERCPRCESANNLRPIQCTVQWKKGRFYVLKTMTCKEHGPFTISKPVKTVLMHGKDADVLPKNVI